MKRLTLFLIFVFITVFSSAFAVEPGPARGQEQGARGLVRALQPEISFSEGQPVTRGAFLEALVRLVSDSSVAEANGPYSDVEADSYLSYSTRYAADAGMLQPGGEFRPAEAILFSEAVKIAVHALGYGVRAEYSGGYPLGYLTAAENIGLTRNLRLSMQDPLTAEQGFRLLFNMLDCDLMVQTNFGGRQRFDAYRGRNLLSEVYQAEKAEGIVNANEFSFLSDSAKALGKGRLLIGADEYIYEKGASFLGRLVEVYYTRRDGQREILYLSDSKTGSAAFSGREVSRFDGAGLEVQREGRTEKYSLAKSFDFLLGGKAEDGALFWELLRTAELTVELLDNDRDGEYEVVKAERWDYCHIYSVNVKDRLILDKNSPQNTIDLSGEDCVYDIYRKGKDGYQKLEFSDLDAGMLVACSASGDGLLQTLMVCDEAVTGKLESLALQEERLRVGGQTLYMGGYARAFLKATPGTEITVFLGINREAVALETAREETRYGWIVQAAQSGNVGEGAEIKLFTQDGEMRVYTVADKATLDGGRSYRQQTVGPVWLAEFFSGAEDDKRFVKYTTNEAGEIKNIDLPEKFSGENPYLEQGRQDDNFTLYYDGSYQYKRIPKSFSAAFSTAGSVMFIVPKDEEDREDAENYQIQEASSYFNNDEYYDIKAYDCAESSAAKALLYFGSVSGQDKALSDVEPAVVQKVTKGLDPDGRECMQVTVWQNRAYLTLYSGEKNEEAAKKLIPGDIIRFIATRQSVMTALSRDYSYQTDEILAGDYGQRVEYIKGLVYSFGDGVINLIKNVKQVRGSVRLEDLRCAAYQNSDNTAFVYVSLEKDGSVKSATVRPTPQSKLVDYIHGGNHASYAVVRQRWFEGGQVVIYQTNREE